MIEDDNDYNNELFEKYEGSDVDLTGCSFANCFFKNCSFNNSNLTKCEFIKCKFENCDMSLIKVKKSRFRDVVFENSKLIGINWTETFLCKSIEFIECGIDHSTFLGMNLKETKIIKCSAREVYFQEADLSQSSFSGTELRGSEFSNSILTGADFREAKNYLINPNDVRMRKAKFSLPEAVNLLYGLDIVLED